MKVQHLLAAIIFSAPILLTGCVYAPQPEQEEIDKDEVIERFQTNREQRSDNRQERLQDYKETQEEQREEEEREEKKAAAKSKKEEFKNNRSGIHQEEAE
jgi:hypothetical protein